LLILTDFILGIGKFVKIVLFWARSGALRAVQAIGVFSKVVHSYEFGKEAKKNHLEEKPAFVEKVEYSSWRRD